MNRHDAEVMRNAFVRFRQRMDEEMIAELDRHITGEIEEAERARLHKLAVEIGLEVSDGSPVEIVSACDPDGSS